MTQVMLARQGAVSDRDREELRVAGIVLVEVENPDDVRFLATEEAINSGDMLYAALTGCSCSKEAQSKFTTTLLDTIVASRAAKSA